MSVDPCFSAAKQGGEKTTEVEMLTFCAGKSVLKMLN